MHKLNVLHWHLTDDQAWRLEIKKYPKLTSVGAWRVPAGQAPRADIDPKTGKPRLYGGFYTQEQARDIVAYAAARHIKVVPEIEMPGHASAAIVAYPELGVQPAANKLKEVPSDWGVYENLFNVEESTFNFLENVMTEVMRHLPERVHPRRRRRGREAAVGEVRRASGAHEGTRRQGCTRAAELLHPAHGKVPRTSKGRRLIGWDEILEGGLAPDATVMSWRGIDGAIAAAKAGHDTVLSPAPDLYLDHWQSAGDLSPGRSNTLSLEMVYGFEPMPASIPEEQRKHILGVQANLWAEMMRTEERVDYMAVPAHRGAGRSGLVARRSASTGTDFQRRLDPQLRATTQLGIRWAREVQINPLPTRRLSHDLEQCGDGYLLSLEDDAPHRRRTRGVPGEHLQPVLDLAWRRSHQACVRCAPRSARSRSISRSAQDADEDSAAETRRPAMASSKCGSTAARARRRVSASLTPAREQLRTDAAAADRARGENRHARSVLQIHARQRRSHLGHRQPSSWSGTDA